MTKLRDKLFFRESFLFFTLFLCILCLASCSKGSNIIDLSTAPLLPVDSQWGLITDPYAIFRSEPDIAAGTAGYGRRGDLHEIKGRRIISENNKQVTWYQFTDGWLPDTSIQVYPNELKAKVAAKELDAASNLSH